MRKHVVRVVLFALLVAGVLAPFDRKAEAICQGTIPSLEAFADEQITVSSTAIGFTAATFAPSGASPAIYALVSIETNPIRYRVNGLNPTASVGVPVSAGQTIEVCGATAVRALRMIRTGADATATAVYYKGAGQ